MDERQTTRDVAGLAGECFGEIADRQPGLEECCVSLRLVEGREIDALRVLDELELVLSCLVWMSGGIVQASGGGDRMDFPFWRAFNALRRSA
jgi:hypothetical protein